MTDTIVPDMVWTPQKIKKGKRALQGIGAPFGLRSSTTLDTKKAIALAMGHVTSDPLKIQITLGVGHSYARFVVSSIHFQVLTVGPKLAMALIHPDVTYATHLWTPRTHMRSRDLFNDHDLAPLARGQGLGVVVIPALRYYLKLKLNALGTMETHVLARYDTAHDIAMLLEHDLGLGYEILILTHDAVDGWQEHFLVEAMTVQDSWASAIFTFGGSPILPSFVG